MDLEPFPFDEHECLFQVTSSNFDSTLMLFTSNYTADDVRRSYQKTFLYFILKLFLFLQQHEIYIQEFDIAIKDLPEEEKETYYAPDDAFYTYGGVQIHLKRESNPYIFKYVRIFFFNICV